MSTRTVVSTLLVGWGLFLLSGHARVQAYADPVIADSVEDYSATTHGINGWYYQFHNFAPGPYGNSTGQFAPSGAAVGVWGATITPGVAPNEGYANLSGTGGAAGLNTASQRRWVSTITGSIDISGTVQLLHDWFSPPTYNSVHGASAGIFKDGVLLLSIDLQKPNEADGNGTPSPSIPYLISNQPVIAGVTTIDFELYTGLALDPSVGFNDDVFSFASTITQLPEPASLTLLGSGGAMLLRRRRK